MEGTTEGMTTLWPITGDPIEYSGLITVGDKMVAWLDSPWCKLLDAESVIPEINEEEDGSDDIIDPEAIELDGLIADECSGVGKTMVVGFPSRW